MYKLVPKTVFGISSEVSGAVNFASNEEVIYPAGGLLTIHNFSTRNQKFINIKNDPSKIINIVCVHPNKTTAAVSSTEPKPLLEIYNLETRNLLKAIPVAAAVTTMCYSWDGKHLMYITLESDPVMYNYNFELGKVENTTVATQPPAYLGPVAQIAGNPADSMIVVIVGTGLFRLLNLSDSVWRQYGFQKAENYNFLSVTWINSDKLIAGTSDGRIVLVDSGELKGVFKANDVSLIACCESKEQLQAMTVNTIPKANQPHKSILCIIGFKKGFAFSIDPNVVIVFEKETSEKYVRKREYFVRSDSIEDIPRSKLDKVLSISVSPDENTLICCTVRTQIYSAPLSWSENKDIETRVQLMPLGEQLHYGPIKNLSVSIWKPLFLTSGEVDRRVCVFNYEKGQIVLSQTFNNDVHALDMHSTGLMCAIAFTDECQVCYIMMDRFKVAKNLSCNMEGMEHTPVRSSKVVRFSKYGHMLAVANNLHVKIYDGIQFQLLYSLPGHRVEITAFKWTNRETILLSCGLDGAVYLWDVLGGKRSGDVVSRNCQHRDVTSTADGKLIYTVGEDGRLKEIKDEAVIQDLEVTNCSLTKVIMSRQNDQVMLIADERGHILMINYPVVQKVDYEQYSVHGKRITNLEFINDETHILSSGEEGMICFWHIHNPEGKPLMPKMSFYRCNDILIVEDELKENLQYISDLRSRNKEMEYEQNFKLRELHRAHEESLKKLNINKTKIIQRLNDNIQFLEKEKSSQVAQLMEDKRNLTEKYENQLEELEKHLKSNLLIREYEKSNALEEKLNQLRENNKLELETLKKTFERTIEEIHKQNASEIESKNLKIKKLQERVEEEVKKQDIAKRIVQEDADREIQDLKAKYEELVAIEHENYVKVKNDEGVNKEKIIAMDKEIKRLKAIQVKLNNDITEFQKQNSSYEKSIDELNKEISERDKILIPKEKRVHNLKTKSSILQQEVHVLRMKNLELTKRIQPKDEEILELEETIRQLKEEMSETDQQMTAMDVKVNFLKDGIRAKNKMFEEEKRKQTEMKAVLKKMRIDIYDLHEFLKRKPEELKSAVQCLFNKYVKGKDMETLLAELKDMEEEHLRQRDHLENIIKGLKRRLAREATAPSAHIYLIKEKSENQEENWMLKQKHEEKQEIIKKIEEIRQKEKKQTVNRMEEADENKSKISEPSLETILDIKTTLQNEFLEKVEGKEKSKTKQQSFLIDLHKEIFQRAGSLDEDKKTSSQGLLKPRKSA